MEKTTKEIIEEVAEKLFRKTGSFNVSVDEITKTAGIAKGTFYIYFKKKEELLDAILNKKYEIYTKKLNEIKGNTNNSKNKLLEVAKFYIKYAYKNKDFFVFLFNLSKNPKNKTISNTVKTKHMKNKKEYKEYFCNILKDGIKKNEIQMNRSVDIPTSIMIFDSMIVGFAHNLFAKQQNKKSWKEIEKEINIMIEVFWKGINL